MSDFLWNKIDHTIVRYLAAYNRRERRLLKLIGLQMVTYKVTICRPMPCTSSALGLH